MATRTIPLLKLDYSDEDVEFIQSGVKDILRSGALTMAGKVHEFESSFARWIGCKYAVGTNSGTSSLEIPLRAIGVENKTVICPTNTYMATPIAAVHAGAKVAFVDSEKEHLQMSVESLRKALDQLPDVAAVMVVHIGGIISPDFPAIAALCRDRGIPVIEDAAHAHGATLDGAFAGTLGVAGSLSFYPTKVLVTAEGGMVSTNDEGLFEKAKILREHGKTDHRFNVHSEFGYNWRFSEFHALLGLQQMKVADDILATRRRLAGVYDRLLAGCDGITRIAIPDNIKSAYYKYICYLDPKIDRTEFKKRMLEQFSVSLTGEVYSAPCHSQPVFTRYPHTMVQLRDEAYENADYVTKHHICPPLYPALSDADVEYVAESMKKCLNSF